MIKSMVTALLAAASLVPMAASAQQQQWQGRGDRPEGQAQDGRGHQGRGDRGQRPQGQPPQAQVGVQAQAQAPANVQQRGDGGQRGNFRGQQSGSRFQDDQARAIAVENAKVQDWANGQNRDPRSGGGNRDGGNARPDQRGQQGDRNRDDQRGRDGQYRGDQYRGGQDRGQYRGGQDRGVNQYRGGQNDRGGQYRDQRGDQNRGTWNRGWRNDGQYNWNGYRAQNRDRFHLPRYYAPGGWNQGYRRFSSGIRLNAYLYDRSYWISDPYDYRLPEAYGPYRWVRYYDDALLVDLRSGQVVDTVYGIFW